MTAFGGIEIDIEGSKYVPVADPTGELNAIVWESMGHLRGSFSHCLDAEAHTQDDSNAVRWPQPRVIPIPRPENLQLNELYWPTLVQHASELWVVLPTEDAAELADRLKSLSKLRRIDVSFRGIIYQAYAAGVWILNQHRPDEVMPPGSSVPAQELVLVCFTDQRIHLRDRLEYINTPLDGGEELLQSSSGASVFGLVGSASLTGVNYQQTSSRRWIDNQGVSGVVPCRMSAAKVKPIFSVWVDSTNIGLGSWPVFVPRGVSGTLSFVRYFESSALWDSYSSDGPVASTHTSVLARPAKEAVENTRDSIRTFGPFSSLAWTFPGALTSVYGMARRNGLASGNTHLTFVGGSQSHFPDSRNYLAPPSSRASTAFFSNINTAGQYTGFTGLASVYAEWLAHQNMFRYMASTRPGRKLVVDVGGDEATSAASYFGLLGFSSGSSSVRMFPPSAWIFRPAAVSRVLLNKPETFTDLDTTLNSAIEVEEIPWLSGGLPSEFQVTWSSASSGVTWIDSGQVGECHKVYYNFGTGYWYRRPPSTLGDTIDNRSVINFTYRCEAVRYLGYSVLTPEQVGELPDWCESETLACYPPVFGGYQMEAYYWHQRPCTAMIIRTNRNSPIAGDPLCWEMIWGASFVYRINPPPEDEPPIPTPPTQPPDEPIEPQPGLPVPPGYG